MKALFRSKLFWAGLAVRLTLIPFFGSSYLRELFIPFLDSAITQLGTNPWSLNPPHYFPYGSVLFVLLMIPKSLGYLVFGETALGTSSLSIALMKLPLLGLDILLLLTLAKLAKTRAPQVLKLYWLNPIVIFVCYAYGQLDIGAMAFCILSLYALLRRKTAKSAAFFAAATLCKFHVVAIVPLIVAYLWNGNFRKNALKTLSVWISLWGALSLMGFLPLILAKQFMYASTSSPEAFRLFSLTLPLGEQQIFYLGVFLVLAILGRLCISSRLTDGGLIFGSGLVFGMLVLVTNPFPGWYLWPLPFICLFFSLYLNAHRSLLSVFTGLYLVYFVGLEPLGIEPSSLAHGVSFTLLQTSLIGILVVLWALAVKHEAILTGRVSPMLIGVTGDSGSGKNHLSRLMTDIFNPQNTVVIEGDDYHKWERSHERWRDYTHLSPRANHLMTMAVHAQELSKGLAVVHSHYDHSSGMFTAPREIKPAKVMIIQGLHALYLKGMRNRLDLKVFLDTAEDVRLAWKIKRDVRERGYDPKKVMESIEKRRHDSNVHIRPQREFADWIIQYSSLDAFTPEQLIEGKEPRIHTQHIVYNDASIGDLTFALSRHPEIKFAFESLPDDINRVAFSVAGNPSAAQIGEIATDVFPNLRHLTRGREGPVWHSGSDGVTQLVAIALMGDLQ